MRSEGYSTWSMLILVLYKCSLLIKRCPAHAAEGLHFSAYYIFALLKVKAVMDQFKGGLEAGGVLRYLKKFYDLLTPLFVNENKLFTASKYNIAN